MAEPARPLSENWDAGCPLEVTYEEIRAASERGDVVPLSDVITDIVRYRDHWWIAHTHTWLLITDQATNAKLDRHADWANPKLLQDP